MGLNRINTPGSLMIKLIAGEQMSEFTFSPDFKTIEHPAELTDLTLNVSSQIARVEALAEASWEHIQVHDIDRPATSPKITFTPTTPNYNRPCDSNDFRTFY